MDQVTDWKSGFVVASVLQSTVFGMLLWPLRERMANRWLSVALLVLAGILVVYPLGWRGREEVPLWLVFLPINLPLALGPLLYIYTRHVAQLATLKRAWVHFVPAALHFAYLVTLSLLPFATAFQWKEDIHDDFVKPLIEIAVLISLVAYGACGIRMLRDFRARLLAYRSDADFHDARWLSRLLLSLIGSFSILAAVRLYTYTVAEVGSGIHILWLAIWAAWLGVEGWRVAGIPAPVLIGPEVPPERPSQDWGALGTDWHARTREAGWWREPDLTLPKLARLLGTNTLYLSRAINEGLGINFNEMVNRLRADDVARAINAGEGRSDLLQLAMTAGFRSKATFNRAFRSAYGMSPSQYRERIKS